MSRSPYVCMNFHCTRSVQKAHSWCERCLDVLEQRLFGDNRDQQVREEDTEDSTEQQTPIT